MRVTFGRQDTSRTTPPRDPFVHLGGAADRMQKAEKETNVITSGYVCRLVRENSSANVWTDPRETAPHRAYYTQLLC